MALTNPIVDGDWRSVRQAIQQLSHLRLGPDASPTFVSMTLSGLTTDSLLYASSGGTISSLGAATDGQIPIGSTGTTPVLATITGTANQVTVTNGAGSITLSAPQDIATTSSPTFEDITITGLSGTTITTESVETSIEELDAAIGGISTDHGSLSGLADDDHTQYLLVDGTRAMTGLLDASAAGVLTEDAGTSVPITLSDGYIGTAEIGGEGRFYWVAEGKRYWITGTKNQGGSPYGLLLSLTQPDVDVPPSVTYNNITAANYTAANLLTACATNAGALDFSAASKTLTVEDDAIVSQDYSSDASPTFAGLDLTGVTDGNIPYVSAAGFVDSPMTTNGTTVDIGTSTYSGNTSLGINRTLSGSGFKFALAIEGSYSSTDENCYGLYFNPTMEPANNKKATAVSISGTINAPVGETFSSIEAANFATLTKTGTGTITTCKGLYVRNQNIGTTNWNLYVEGSSYSWIEGNLALGSFYDNVPVTQVEISSGAPYITLHNRSHEDNDGGRESRLIARGEQSGEEETVLGWLEFSHDGAADDEKGKVEIKLNDGDDDTTPSLSALKITSAGIVTMNSLYACRSDGDTGGTGSAGAGKQYVEMEINGTTYKVLHDGTV